MRKIDYPGMYRRVYGAPRTVSALRHAHTLLVIFVVVSFVMYVVGLAYFERLTEALLTLAVSGAPFAVVTLARRLLGHPRPYELMDFSELGIAPPRERGRDSFPSRHSFSAFLIGTLLVFDMPLLGAAILISGTYIATARVLLGYHFISDVTVGALIGALTGVIGVLCISLF